MTRPFRLVATLAVAVTLTLGVAVRFVRADSSPAVAAAVARELPATEAVPSSALASAGQDGLPGGALQPQEVSVQRPDAPAQEALITAAKAANAPS